MSVNASTLFEVLFPMMLEQKKSRFASIDAFVVFHVKPSKKDGQSGTWTLDLRAGSDGTVTVGPPPSAPALEITLAEEFLDDFVEGTYDPMDTLQRKRLVVRGEWAVFEKLSQLMDEIPMQETAAAGGGLEPPRAGGVSRRG